MNQGLLLTIDIGNTHVVIGVFKDEALIKTWRLSTDPRKTADEICVYIDQLFRLENFNQETICGIAMASVVPRLTDVYRQAAATLFDHEVLVLNHETPIGIENDYEDPAQVGADRLANAVGALTMYQPPLIIVDFGTSITLDVVSPDKKYLGGIILPGPEMAAESLYRKAAQLPQIIFERPDEIVGRSTTNSIRSGLYFGLIGAVDHLIKMIRESSGIDYRAIATGGLGNAVLGESEYIEDYSKDITLIGLKEIWQRNRF